MKVRRRIELSHYVHSSLVSGFNMSEISHPQTKSQAFGTTVIQNGARGAKVRNVQDVLYRQGFLSYSDTDGVFGNQTKAAVIDFQHRHFGYGTEDEPDPGTGKVDAQTKTKMWSLYQNDLITGGYYY